KVGVGEGRSAHSASVSSHAPEGHSGRRVGSCRTVTPSLTLSVDDVKSSWIGLGAKRQCTRTGSGCIPPAIGQELTIFFGQGGSRLCSKTSSGGLISSNRRCSREIIHLDSTQMRRSGVLADAVTGLEHTVSGTVQGHERGEGAEPRGPDVLTPTPGPEETPAHA